MKILLAFPPFHTPASPPFGLACLKGALAQARPEVQVKTVDWNLDFFRRWLNGDMPDLCRHHPDQLLGTACPWTVARSGVGRQILADLTRLPTTPDAQARYMQAAQLLDDVYNRLAEFYHGLLFPVVEGRLRLSRPAAQEIFGAELAQIEAFQPDLVGFSILAEQNLLYALALGRVIRQQYGIPVALGGAMMSHLEPVELLQAFPWLDFVFFGEAEQNLADFVDAWPKKQFQRVYGLAYRQGGKINECCKAPPLNLADLPAPDFSDFPLSDYIVPEPVLPIITCRGCYWGKCTFCSHTRPYGPVVRVRQPEQVVDELALQMERYGVRRFLFVDEAISPKMMRRLSEEILARGLNLQFGAEGVRVEKAFDIDLLRLAYQAGLRWVYVGIESGTQRLLEMIEKGISIKTVERFIADCREVGITPQLSFIIGLPGTTPEELQNEIAFLKRHPMDSSSFVLLVGSPMQERPEDFGIRIEDRQVLYITSTGVVHSPRFFFTVETGLSPVQADMILEASGPRPRMRPHLGEVHATLLADTDFFASEERPPAPPPAAEIALQWLTQENQAAGTAVDGRWFLHVAGCLEALERVEEAFAVVQAGLAADGRDPLTASALRLHQAAILNRSNHPHQALQILNSPPRTRTPHLPALHAERARAFYALGHLTEVGREIKAMLAAGYEIRWMYYIQGLCYEKLNRPARALKAYQTAELRDWTEPEINEAKARCLEA
ncbi:MAG: radical SAM protein, partial [Chloroflexi bacterium]